MIIGRERKEKSKEIKLFEKSTFFGVKLKKKKNRNKSTIIMKSVIYNIQT